MNNNYVQKETMIAGKRMVLETGQVARQAHGAVIITLGDTKVFAAVVAGKPRDDIDFFPLTVDYREKTEAAGKIPGGFFKREGRPTTKEVLTMRMIDRSIRPMFTDGFKGEVQVMSHVLQYDGVNNPDVLGMIASFAAIRVGGLPFETTMAAARVAHIDGELCVFPDDTRRREDSRLDLVVAGHNDGVCMVESSAKELTEAEMLDALELGHNTINEIIELVNSFVEEAGKPAMDFTAPVKDEEMWSIAANYKDQLLTALATDGKAERNAAVKAVRNEFVEATLVGVSEADNAAKTKAAKTVFHDFQRDMERDKILSGQRSDGRAADEIREITIVPDFVPRQHGSVLFTRGETQALVSATLGTPDDEMIIDGVEKEYRKAFYLHYNFPPYSVGETRRFMGPGRREIGHGMLAERALQSILPSKERFPYTVRIVSDITESNGSSSMASVCGGCLAMMCAGVPVSQPIAGIAMGLVKEGDREAILSDILGSEDHNGDMDFKVAGSGIGITALQMDIKVKGVTRDLLERALEQAKQGRVHILKKMLEAVAGPRGEVSEFAPRSIALKIPAEKIGFLIGPGGKNIKALQADYEVKVTIVDDDGNVQIFGVDSAKVKACRDQIKGSTQNPEIGDRFTGTVRSIRDFGAFIEILPGVEGLCHVSELDTGYVSEVSDVISMGDEVEVEVINVDDRGKVKVSRKAVMIANGATPEEGDGPNHEERGDRPSGGRGDRGGRDRESVPRGGGRGRGQRDD